MKSKKPIKKHSTLLACICLFFSLAVSSTALKALEVGEITIGSALGEPLIAEIQISNHDGFGEDDLKVSLAPHKVHQQMNVDSAVLLMDLSFTLSEDGVVKVSSRNPIKEPFLNFILQFRWPDGVMYREFSVLIDPKM